MAQLVVEDLLVNYDEKVIINSLNVEIPKGKITTIIGSNGCGKSTLLKTISRILKPKKGTVFLDGKSIHQQSTKELAKQMAMMPQSPTVPQGLTVYELVSYGRYPHQKGLGRLKEADKKAIEWSLDVTGVKAFANSEVDSLSGGQRQKVWIAMTLAQETDIILLDEPTTYLDMAHQLDILKLLKKLNEQENRTIVMVLHDLNHAARFSDYLITMNEGTIVKTGSPLEVMTTETLKNVYNIEASIMIEPKSGCPICLTYDLCENRELA
ncbi:ABC transporter ATP-binding protein [Domibacillus mangrovi]|uniref:Iron ABC transporter ATP-binding protein n=1 Tax=Domibacillus mangrovi TaxID=1714354 RepID=A0A1Q5P1M5_9BACI|nr:ABC transporter ATP-binding protein [Domibacillus mangrovi]OKL36088.1 iron ABC transporter ATP-binding protein [Domibacillus mangrovi]